MAILVMQVIIRTETKGNRLYKYATLRKDNEFAKDIYFSFDDKLSSHITNMSRSYTDKSNLSVNGEWWKN